MPREILSHCPFCGGDRKLVVRGEHSRTVMDDDGTDEIDCFRILECRDCRRIFVRRDHWRTNGATQTTYWPTED